VARRARSRFRIVNNEKRRRGPRTFRTVTGVDFQATQQEVNTMIDPKPGHQGNRDEDADAEDKGLEIGAGGGGGIQAMPPEPVPPTPDQLDEDEAELRALRIDLPGAGGTAPTGIISIGVTDKLPKSEFIRARGDTIVVNMLPLQTGMEKEFYVVRPEMIPELASIRIDVVAYRLFLIVTTEGAAKIVPARQADVDGSLNEWSRTKEVVLTRAQKVWVRPVSDKPNGRFRCFEAPPGRFPDPIFPDLTWATLMKLGFKERGRLIHTSNHPLFLKLAGQHDASD
jgi:hypothetical protein